MTIRQQIGEVQRSVSLDNASLDFVKYAKALVATRGRPDDALALAVARGASSRLQTMLQTPIEYGQGQRRHPRRSLRWRSAALAERRGATRLRLFGKALWLLPSHWRRSVRLIACFPDFTRMPLHTRIAIASSAALADSYLRTGAETNSGNVLRPGTIGRPQGRRTARCL